MAKKYEEEELRRIQRERRRKEVRRRKRRQVLFQRLLLAGLAVAVFVVVLAFVMGRFWKEETGQKKSSAGDTVQESPDTGEAGSLAENGTDEKQMGAENDENPESGYRSGADEDEHQADTEEDQKSDPAASSGKRTYSYEATEDTKQPGDEIISSYAILVDVEDGTILAGRDEKARIVPASMTKVLTLLVAVENIDDLDATYTITTEVTDYSLRHDCSVAGFEKEETVTIRDLLYGAILPSGADAALSLAMYVSGSQEAFVERMNEKLEELGLSGSAHFTNCVGIYEEDHYCTAYDLAVIMNAAIDNEVCREVLSAHTYTTSRTEQHPEGILLSNWFLRRIEDKDTGGEVLCGKTGYVDQSGSCAVSYGVGENGRSCICVTVNAYNKWKCIKDHAALYKSLG